MKKRLVVVGVLAILMAFSYSLGFSRGQEWTLKETCLLMNDFFELYEDTVNEKSLSTNNRVLLRSVKSRMQTMRYAVANQ